MFIIRLRNLSNNLINPSLHDLASQSQYIGNIFLGLILTKFKSSQIDNNKSSRYPQIQKDFI